MKRRLVLRTSAVAMCVIATSATTAFAASGASRASRVPRPLAGHYKIEKGFSDVSSGSLVVNKAGTTVRHLMFTPKSGLSCPATLVRVPGTFHLHNVADADGGANDNTPDWSITAKNVASRRVRFRQSGKTFHGKLSLGFGSRNGSRRPVKYVEGELDSSTCVLTMGGVHGR